MASAKDLDTGLEQLQSDVAEQNRLYVSSKIALYKALVDTYLWWREASQKTGYLDERFKQENIKYRKQLIVQTLTQLSASFSKCNSICKTCRLATGAVR